MSLRVNPMPAWWASIELTPKEAELAEYIWSEMHSRACAALAGMARHTGRSRESIKTTIRSLHKKRVIYPHRNLRGKTLTGFYSFYREDEHLAGTTRFTGYVE